MLRINYWAVVVAAVAAFIGSSVWYTIFGMIEPLHYHRRPLKDCCYTIHPIFLPL